MRLGTMAAPTDAAVTEGLVMAEGTARALVVDDDRQIAEMIAFALRAHGMDTALAYDADSAWELVRDGSFDLLVLDAMLPGEAAAGLYARVSASAVDTPVLLLVAPGHADGVLAEVKDRLTKPVNPRELAARAQGIVSRVGDGDGGVVVNGPLRIEPATGLVAVGGRRVALTDSELRLLTALVQRTGEVVGWPELLHAVWGTESSVGGREMVKTAVYRLRARLGVAPGGSELIQTVRGHGYLVPHLTDRS